MITLHACATKLQLALQCMRDHAATAGPAAQALRRFGAFSRVRLQPPLPVEQLALAALEAQEAMGHWQVLAPCWPCWPWCRAVAGDGASCFQPPPATCTRSCVTLQRPSLPAIHSTCSHTNTPPPRHNTHTHTPLPPNTREVLTLTH
jgi:hypothetical protein